MGIKQIHTRKHTKTYVKLRHEKEKMNKLHTSEARQGSGLAKIKVQTWLPRSLSKPKNLRQYRTKDRKDQTYTPCSFFLPFSHLQTHIAE